MLSKWFLSVISILWVLSAAQAADAPFELSTLLGIIEQNHFNESSKIEDLIPLFPEEYRRNVTYKYSNGSDDSGAIKPSLSANATFPRAFLWDDLTGHITSFNGDPSQVGYQDLEMMQWDPKNSATHFTKLTFPLKPGYKVEEPESCRQCHGPGNRPVWKMYPLWPGMVGSINDELEPKDRADPGDSLHAGESVETYQSREEIKSRELALYTGFGSQALSSSDHARYLSLFPAIFPEKDPTPITFPYRLDSRLSPADIPSRAFTTRPNLRVGILLNRFNVLRVMKQLRADPIYQQFKETLLFNWMDCNWANLNATTKASLFKRFQAALKAKSRVVDLARFSAPGKQKDVRAHLASVGLKLIDIDIRATYTDGAEKTVYSKLGFHDSYFDGSATTNELFTYLIWQDILADAKLNSKALPYSSVYVGEGLTSKYKNLKLRYSLDQRFFERMDNLSRWFPLPYPSEKFIAEHRETVPKDAMNARIQLCGELRAHFTARESTK
jgi:hypothetical protein